MDALQAAQSIYNSTIKNLAGKEVELDIEIALATATFAATLAQAEAAQRQAAALERVAMQLSNIHLALITPDADREPVTAADMLKRIADALAGADGRAGGSPLGAVADYIAGLKAGIQTLKAQTDALGDGPSDLDNF